MLDFVNQKRWTTKKILNINKTTKREVLRNQRLRKAEYKGVWAISTEMQTNCYYQISNKQKHRMAHLFGTRGASDEAY